MRCFGRLFVLGTAAVGAVVMAQPAYATASQSDLTIRVDQATGAVGSTIQIHDHVQDLGPESTDTSAFTIETIAPAGAELTDTYDPAACTWIEENIDVRCYYTAQLWWKYNSPTPNDYPGTFGIKILKPITAPGKIILACRSGMCIDPDTSNNSAYIIVNGVGPTHKPSSTPSSRPSLKPSRKPLPKRSPKPSPRPSPSPVATPLMTPPPATTSDPAATGIAAAQGSSVPVMAPVSHQSSSGGLGAMPWAGGGGLVLLGAGYAVFRLRNRRPAA